MPYVKYQSDGYLSIKQVAKIAGLDYWRLYEAIAYTGEIDPPQNVRGKRGYYKEKDIPKVIKQYYGLPKLRGVK